MSSLSSGGGAVSAGGLTGDIQPIWNTSNAIGTESLGGSSTGIWNPSNPIGTDTLNSATRNPNGPDWWDRNIGSIDANKLAAGLGGLGKAAGGGGGGGGGQGQMAQAGSASSSAGRGGSNLFNEVVAQMMKRQQLYAGNANPLGATSVEANRARGMLGI
jgi:hypothetical protein